MDGSVLEEKSFFKMLGLNWIGPLTLSLSLLVITSHWLLFAAQGAGIGLLISMLEKCWFQCWFCLTGLIILVLLI